MSHQFTFTVDHEIGELEVTYTVTPFIEATYWQPAEGGECEIISVKHEGREMNLPSVIEDALLEIAIDRSRQDMTDDADDLADYRFEQYRDRQMTEKWENEQ